MKKPLILLLLIAVATVKIYSQQLSKFSWLTGSWKVTAKNGTVIEYWELVDDSTMQGRGYNITNTGDTVINETIQLVCRSNNYFYISTTMRQNNQQPVSFSIVSSSEKAFVAQNKEHDFPQRISYELKKAGILYAFIDGNYKGKYAKKEFSYEKMK